MENTNIANRIKMLLYNYDMTIAYALGEIALRQETINLYKNDKRKFQSKEFVAAKIDLEKYEIFLKELQNRKNELSNAIEEMLSMYQPKYKDIFWMFFIYDKSYEQIKVATGYSIDNIKKVIKKLKDGMIASFTLPN